MNRVYTMYVRWWSLGLRGRLAVWLVALAGRRRVALAVFAACVVAAPALAAAPLRVPEGLDEVEAGQFVDYFLDPTSRLEFDDVAGGKMPWQSANGRSVNLGFTKGTLWARLRLEDARARDPVPAGLVLAVTHATLDTVTVYERREAGVVVRRAGDHVPRAEWPEGTPYATFPLEEFRELEVIIRVNDASLELPLVLRSTSHDAAVRLYDTALRAAYISLALGLLLYNALLWLGTRLPLYGPYCLYVSSVIASLAAVDGTGYAIFWRDHSWLNDYVAVVALGLVAASVLRLQRGLLSLKTTAPGLARVNELAEMATYAALPLALAMPWPWPMWYMIAGPLTMCALTVHAATRLAMDGNRAARLFLAAFGSAIVAMVIASLAFTGMLDIGPYWTLVMPLGASVQLVLFAYALADRIKTLQADLTTQAHLAADNANLAREATQTALGVQERANAQLVLLTQEARDASKQAVTAREIALRELEARRRLQGELDTAAQQLTQAENMATLGMLMAGIAHDLRNPLNYVQGAATDLRELIPSLASGGTDERAVLIVRIERYVGWVEQGTATMDAISLAMRNQARGGGADVEVMNLREVVDEALLLCKSRTIVAQLTVEAEDATMLADPTGVGQLVMNLVSNAADALVEAKARGHAPEPRILVRAWIAAGTAVLEVHDSGEGIPEGLRAKILEPFFTTKPRGQGTGLGLAIVQRVTKAHGGSLEIGRSGALGGAMFRVQFAVQR